jgi:hypothetical protein
MNKLFESFDRLNNTKTSKLYEAKRRMYEHINQLNLVGDDSDLNESDNTEEREKVLSDIKNNNFESDPEDFFNSMKDSKHEEMLTFYNVNELSRMKLFKVPGYNIGYALKKRDDKSNDYNEIVAVHNNEKDIKGVGDELIQSAIENGGCYLDHYDGFLSNFYERNGFIEYKRDDFDPQYDKDGKFEKKYGRSDVVYRIHKSCK